MEFAAREMEFGGPEMEYGSWKMEFGTPEMEFGSRCTTRFAGMDGPKLTDFRGGGRPVTFITRQTQEDRRPTNPARPPMTNSHP